MEKKEKAIVIPINVNQSYELKFDLFMFIDQQNQYSILLKRDYDSSGNLKQLYIEREFFTNNKECKQTSYKQNINEQTECPKQEHQEKLPLIIQSKEDQTNNHNYQQLNSQQKLNYFKYDNSRPSSALASQNHQQHIFNKNNNILTTQDQQQYQKQSNSRFPIRPPSNIKRTQQINAQQSIIEQKNIQRQPISVSHLIRYTSQQHTINKSWFRYNQNILYSDIDQLDNNYSWLPNTILDAMANRHNQELYKEYFDKSIHQPKLIHVFPTIVYDEIERQRIYKVQNKKFVDCFVFTQELQFLQKAILQIYDKFYFLVSNNYHYYLIEVLLQKQVIYIYDSMFMKDKYQQKIIKENIENILIRYDIKIQFQTIDIQPYPRQKDSSNCGIFALYYLKQLLAGNDLRKATDLITQNFRLEIKKILNPKIRILNETNIHSG